MFSFITPLPLSASRSDPFAKAVISTKTTPGVPTTPVHARPSRVHAAEVSHNSAKWRRRMSSTTTTTPVCTVSAPAVTHHVADISEADIVAVQKQWGEAIVSISQVHASGGDFVQAAAEAAGNLYGYAYGPVLFKPTKATRNPFRPTAEGAMSYFVGADAMNNEVYKGEDRGFAINGGRGWSRVVFHNHRIEVSGTTAVAMGDYTFTDATSGEEVRVEFTFGYKRNDDGRIRIHLHHSSMPFSP